MTEDEAAFLVGVGWRVRWRRIELGWTVARAARAAGVCDRVLIAVEHGQRPTDLLRLRRIAVAFGLEPSALLSGPVPAAVDLRLGRRMRGGS